MLYHSNPTISVIIASCRPQWLANCLAQLRAQSDPPQYEIVVVAEGDDGEMLELAGHFAVDEFITKPIEGNCGAAAKDVGTAAARGEYVVYWDDDNHYEQHALRSLYEAAAGVDLGVVCARHWTGDRFVKIPKLWPCAGLGDFDTMCACVSLGLARSGRWHDGAGPGTDYRWLARLLERSPTARFADVIIGHHYPSRTHERRIDGIRRQDT